MNYIYRNLVNDVEEKYEIFANNQCLDTTSLFYGGNVEEHKQLISPKSTFSEIVNMITLYFNENSKYYKNENLLKTMYIAISYIEKIQREDGNFDNHETNFYASPNTAFCINRVMPAFTLAKKSNTAEGNKIVDKLLPIFKKSGYGIASGGFHTPNHRWAIASALYSLYNIFSIDQFKNVADKYLKEGIDQDEDGDFAERSAGKYNIVNNLQLMVLWEETSNDKYLHYINKNLEMMMYLIEPDGSIFTSNSTRLDRLNKTYPDEYFYLYLYIGSSLQNTRYINIAKYLIENIIKFGRQYPTPHCLAYLMNKPELIKLLDEPLSIDNKETLPTEYKKSFKASGVHRVRSGDYTFTLSPNTSKFLVFQKGEIQIFFKVGTSYFKARQLTAENIVKIDDTYKIEYKAKGWYYLPFDEEQGTTNWWELDNSKRKKVNEHDLNITILIKEIETGISLNIITSGCDRVPIKVEMGITKDVMINSDAFTINGMEAEAFTVRSGIMKIVKGKDTVEIGNAFATHNFVEGSQNSEPRDKNMITAYFTDYSNFNRTINIKTKGGSVL